MEFKTAFVVLVLAIGLMGCTASGGAQASAQVSTTEQPTVTATATATATSTPTATATATATASTTVQAEKEFTITAKNWEFSPSTITVKKGDKVKLHVKSLDVPHGIAIAAYGISENLAVGEEITVEFTADKTGNFTFFCNVFCGSGHQSMKGTLIVEE